MDVTNAHIKEINEIHTIMKSHEFEKMFKKSSLEFLDKLRRCLERDTVKAISILNLVDKESKGNERLELLEGITTTHNLCKPEKQIWKDIYIHLGNSKSLFLYELVLREHKIKLLDIVAILIDLYGRFEKSTVWLKERKRVYSKNSKLFKCKLEQLDVRFNVKCEKNECQICKEDIETLAKPKTCVCNQPNICVDCLVKIFFNEARENINDFQSKCPYCRNSFTLSDIQPFEIINVKSSNIVDEDYNHSKFFNDVVDEYNHSKCLTGDDIMDISSSPIKQEEVEEYIVTSSKNNIKRKRSNENTDKSNKLLKVCK